MIDYTEAHKNGFVHEWTKDNHGSLVMKVDTHFGKWPDGYKYLKFYHGMRRDMEFSNNGYNTEFWTVVMNEQDYYKHKVNQIPWEQIA